MGANMRLGAYPCDLEPGTVAHQAYGTKRIQERHRHRYELNPEFLRELGDRGLRITGLSPDGRFVEIVEIEDHPWYLACQFHPEFTSKPLRPHPLFRQFIAASHARKRSRTTAAQKV
jgi:CTP synthase